MCVVHPITRSNIDFQLDDTVPEFSMLARVAACETFDPCLDSGTALQVLQTIKPIGKSFRCLDLSHKANGILQDTNCKGLRV